MKSPWIRRIALAAMVLLLLLVVAAGVLVANFDANRYKGLAIAWMKNERQRTLAIDGPIELSVFPRLAIKVSKLRLSERERARGSEFAAIDEASLSVQVWPLLGRQVVIDRIRASGVRAVFSRDATGARNIDDLLAGDGRAGAGTDRAAGGPPLRWNVSAVQIDNMQLRVRDEMADLTGDITLHSLVTGHLANQTETPVTLRASMDLTRPKALKATLDGRTRLTLDLDNGAFVLGELKLDARGDVGGVKALALGLEARKLAFDPAGRQLELDALRLSLAGKRGADPFEFVLDWPRLRVGAQRLDASAVSGRYKLGGATALAGTFTSAAASGNIDALRLPGVAITLAGNAGPRKLDGNASADLLVWPQRSAATIERLELAATIAEPGAQPLQIALRGSGGADANGAQWKLDGALNSNRFDSGGSAAFGAGAPTIKASARFDSLDVNRLLSPDKAVPAAAAPADTPVQLDALSTVNGQFSFTAGALAFRQYKVTNARLEATLDDGTLRIARLAGNAWGGSIDANGSAHAGGKAIAVRLAASGVNVNALLKDVTGKDLLEGTGRVTADLTTSGATLGALRSNLAGTTALQLRDGAVKGINLARAMRQAKAALALKQDALSKAREAEKTDFSELSASARIADGVAVSDDLDVKSPFLRIGGAGRFDIGHGSVDYTARATVVAATAGQDAGDLSALRGVTVPVHLSGPIEAIDWKIEWSSVAAAVLENKLRDKLGARLGVAPPAGAASASASPQDKLKDKLKGLFK